MHVVFCGSGWPDIVNAIRACLPVGVSIRQRDLERPLSDEIRDANVILPSNALISAEEIECAPNLALIQQPAVGHEGIDLEAARRRGIPVCNAPGTNGEAVAEAALLLMLALARRLPEAQRAFTDGKIGAPVGRELCGKTLGLIGRGRSASHLSKIAEAMRMHVMSVDSKSCDADLTALLEDSDVVSIHCPLTQKTRHLFDERVISRMRKGAVLVNCARGAIIERSALEHALDTGHLGGAGLDTFWEEPWDPDATLFQHSKVVTLPHVGGSTEEAFDRIAAIVGENVRRVQAGDALLHRVA